MIEETVKELRATWNEHLKNAHDELNVTCTSNKNVNCARVFGVFNIASQLFIYLFI